MLAKLQANHVQDLKSTDDLKSADMAGLAAGYSNEGKQAYRQQVLSRSGQVKEQSGSQGVPSAST